MLRNPDDSLVKKALMRVHVRWWHATTEQLSQTLRAAGSPPRAPSMIPDVVNGCQICRNWKRPSNRTIVSGALSSKFNNEVQVDLLFYNSLLQPSRNGGEGIPILHVIDTCLRWSAAVVLPDKSEQSLLNAPSTIWISVFGAPGVFTQDEERGLK